MNCKLEIKIEKEKVVIENISSVEAFLHANSIINSTNENLSITITEPILV